MLFYDKLVELTGSQFFVLAFIELIAFAVVFFKTKWTLKDLLVLLICSVILSLLSLEFVRGTYGGSYYTEKLGWPFQYYHIFRDLEADGAAAGAVVPFQFIFDLKHFLANTFYWAAYPFFIAFALKKLKLKPMHHYLPTFLLGILVLMTAWFSHQNYSLEQKELAEAKLMTETTPTLEEDPEFSATMNTAQTADEAFLAFFDTLSKGDYEQAANYYDFEGHGDQFVYGTSHNGAQRLEEYCQAVPTCLSGKILKTEDMGGGKYTLTVQFINEDGSTYINGPCCGASEEDMPSQDTFEFSVEKIDGLFKVTTAPLYRP